MADGIVLQVGKAGCPITVVDAVRLSVRSSERRKANYPVVCLSDQPDWKQCRCKHAHANRVLHCEILQPPDREHHRNCGFLACIDRTVSRCRSLVLAAFGLDNYCRGRRSTPVPMVWLLKSQGNVDV